MQSSMRDYQVQEMSTAIWAMATLGRSSEALLEACAQEALRRGFETFAPQAISNFVWGFAVLGYCNNAFLSVRCAARLAAPAAGALLLCSIWHVIVPSHHNTASEV